MKQDISSGHHRRRSFASVIGILKDRYQTVVSLVCLMVLSQMIGAQSGPIADFSMDDCALTDREGAFGGIVFGPSCGCGVVANAMSFDGGSQFAEIDRELNSVFENDWSLSTYVQVQNQGSESVDILFLGQSCGVDSILSLRYLPTSRRFRFVLSDSPNNEIQVDGLADDNSCWQYIVVTKARSIVRIYINGILVDQDEFTSDLPFIVDAPLSITNSPCQSFMTNPDVAFSGLIDELKIFDRALTEREIGDAYLLPDKITTRDTTIFTGSSIRLMTGGTCSDDFSWSPDTDLDDPDLLQPTTSPIDDITYTLTVNGDGCQSIDQVTVRIADASELTCDNLILPSAFTPNDDRINDNYGISNQFLVTALQSFEIFNRWGGRVFFTNDVSGTWDGLYKGEPAPPNAYLYKVVYVCESEIFTKTGTINLIR